MRAIPAAPLAPPGWMTTADRHPAFVRYRAFGEGTVTGFEDGRLTAVYDTNGYRTVLADDAISHGTLAAVD